MGTLNVVNKSPFEKRSLEQCLKRIGKGDSVLLIEDAVVSAAEGTSIEAQIAASANEVEFFVLQPDLDARGLAEVNLLNSVESVDYAGFVELVVKHERVHSWL